MPGFKLKNYKPFQCDIIEVDSVLVKKVLINFGTVICTASNSLANYFIPKIQGKELLRSNEDNFLENNTLIINGSSGASLGYIALKIKLKDFQTLGPGSVSSEWYNAFVNVTPTFKTYINKYVLPSMIEKRISSSFDSYNYSEPSTGLTKKALRIIPGPEAKAKEIQEIRELAVPGAPTWLPENSSVYRLIDVDDAGNPVDLATLPFNAKPLDICFDQNFFPLVNVSNIIESVDIEFIETSSSTLADENLDKYNFIENNIKYIVIACINAGSLEQIVDFDYIYSFPYYFSIDKAKTFKSVT
jgi:hypothetical protein